MPTYDYVCADCGQRIEVMHSVHEPGPTQCPACGGTMRKALSTPAIVFKGSGWAKKDARSAARRSSAKEDKAVGTESEKAPASEGGTKAAKEATSPSSD